MRSTYSSPKKLDRAFLVAMTKHANKTIHISQGKYLFKLDVIKVFPLRSYWQTNLSVEKLPYKWYNGKKVSTKENKKAS